MLEFNPKKIGLLISILLTLASSKIKPASPSTRFLKVTQIPNSMLMKKVYRSLTEIISVITDNKENVSLSTLLEPYQLKEIRLALPEAHFLFSTLKLLLFYGFITQLEYIRIMSFIDKEFTNLSPKNDQTLKDFFNTVMHMLCKFILWKSFIQALHYKESDSEIMLGFLRETLLSIDPHINSWSLEAYLKEKASFWLNATPAPTIELIKKIQSHKIFKTFCPSLAVIEEVEEEDKDDYNDTPSVELEDETLSVTSKDLRIHQHLLPFQGLVPDSGEYTTPEYITTNAKTGENPKNSLLRTIQNLFLSSLEAKTIGTSDRLILVTVIESLSEIAKFRALDSYVQKL